MNARIRTNSKFDLKSFDRDPFRLSPKPELFLVNLKLQPFNIFLHYLYFSQSDLCF